MAKFVDIKAKFNLKPITKKTQRQMKEIRQLPARTLNYFKAQTPIDTGNARRSTKLEGTNTIHGDYPYAQRLEDGWSDQAPQGMIKPTERWLRTQFKRIFGRR